MTRLELTPDLTSCIETVAKREYRKALGKLLSNSEASAKLGEKVELLRLFLEKMDFGKLRTESARPLLDGKKVTFVVYLEEGLPQYEMHVE